MNKIFSFLKKSNRYKNIIGGLLVGLYALSPWVAIYSAIIAASCLELKDKLRETGTCPPVSRFDGWDNDNFRTMVWWGIGTFVALNAAIVGGWYWQERSDKR